MKDDHSEKEEGPATRYVATADSLDKAQFLADRLGLAMDREVTTARARDLHALYFADIRTLLPEYCSDMQFEDMAGHTIQVYLTRSGGLPHLRFDQHYSMWLFSLNLISVIFSCYRLSDEDMQILGDMLEDRLMQWHHPMDYEATKDLGHCINHETQNYIYWHSSICTLYTSHFGRELADLGRNKKFRTQCAR
ncbi:MAG: hypothetical protein Tsb002_03670 [Wenzhouxiangellaceae bacterium]